MEKEPLNNSQQPVIEISSQDKIYKNLEAKKRMVLRARRIKKHIKALEETQIVTQADLSKEFNL